MVSPSRENMVVDYKDVFGGPPTKASLHEARLRSRNPIAHRTDPTSKQITKKDFINPYDDFFDDIFKLNYESAHHRRRDNIYSSPTNEKLGFSRSLLFEVDSQQSRGSFVPAPYSFVSRLGKGGDLPAFGTASVMGKNDGGAKASRNPVMKIREILESGIHSKSNFWKDTSPKIGESFRSIRSDASHKGSKSDRWLFASDSEVAESRSGRFQFSIYSWAKKGIASSIIPRSAAKDKDKDKDKGQINRCSSFSGWLHGDHARKRISRVTSRDREFPSFNSDSSTFFDFVKDFDIERPAAPNSSDKALATNKHPIFRSDVTISRPDTSTTPKPENAGKVKDFIKLFTKPQSTNDPNQRYPIEPSSSLKTVSQLTSLSSTVGHKYDWKYKPKYVSSVKPLASDAETSEGASENGSDNSQFQVEELREEEGKMSEEMKAMNEKVERWSKGKEGNIRSLLSTLQYVLWAESGWKPVPLVDIVEGNAVRKTYQRALLCVHPDKLQQKGALAAEKHLAEKVHGILQDAWTYFSTQSSLL